MEKKTIDISKKKNEYKDPFVVLIMVMLMLFLVISAILTIYTIPAGYRGVLLTFGKPSPNPIEEGLNFKIPYIQNVIKMDVRTTKYEAALTAASKDLQDVNTKIAINYHILPESSVDIYRTIGTNYAEKVIFPLEQESNKAATAQYTAVELITKREEVTKMMESILREKLEPRGIIVESISIIDFAFSSSFTAAIEAKVTAEQNALAAKNKLEQIKYEADQRVTQAKGEADAIAIQANAINAQGGKDYVQLQAINKWDGKLPAVMMGSGSTPFIDISKVIENA